MQAYVSKGGVTLEPFRMGECWYIRDNKRLIQFESYSAAWDYLK